MRNWHGWSRQAVHKAAGAESPPVGPALYIGKLPYRKRVALYSTGKTMQVHAYFRNEKEAQRALQLLDFIIFGDPLDADGSGL